MCAIVYISSQEEDMQNNKNNDELTKRVATLQSRVSSLTDQVAGLSNDLKATQDKVAEDMRRLANQVTVKN
tara:strand:+ start:1806 stop:2018 length:213 start_codon:yes stop_codon:yes gene_type:complete